MRINKRMQYGLLFALYLCRAGRTTVASAAEGLGVSETFLYQIARQLRIGKVVKNVRGPGGGVELVGEPTVLDVFSALAGGTLLRPKEYDNYVRGQAEHRALARFTKTIDAVLWTALRRKVRSLGADLVSDELGRLNSLKLETAVN